MPCPICSDPVMRGEIDTVCPICGRPGIKPELDATALAWIEDYLDRAEDERVFGTPKPKVVIQ
jgi:endogenous inhibitor of DNA gyrase (YacG/DUF329 family)